MEQQPHTESGVAPEHTTAPRLLDLLPAYAAYVTSGKASARAADNYCRTLRPFIRWLGSESTVAELHESRLVAYLKWHAAAWSDASAKARRGAIQSFCAWVAKDCPASRTAEPEPAAPVVAPDKYRTNPALLPLAAAVADLLPAYSSYLASRGISRYTAASYGRQIHAFAAYLGVDAVIADLRGDRLITYLEKHVDRWSDMGLAARRKAVQDFCTWIGDGCPERGTPQEEPPSPAPPTSLVHGTALPLMIAVDEWLSDLQLDGRASGTIKKHKHELTRLGDWLSAQALDWQTIRMRDLRVYTRLRAHVGASMRSNMLCSLRVFYDWAKAQDYVTESPAKDFTGPTMPNPLPRTLTRDQVAAVIAYVAALEGRRGRRDQAVVLTMLYAGLRCAEAARLRWNDLDMTEKLISIPISKMGHGRVIAMHPALHKALSDWRAVQGLGEGAPVFGDTHDDCTYGRALDPRRLSKIVRQISDGMQLKFTAHQLRHSFATHMLRGSGNLYAVSKSLGHSDIKQTMRYVSVDVEHLRAALDTLPDIKEW